MWRTLGECGGGEWPLFDAALPYIHGVSRLLLVTLERLRTHPRGALITVPAAAEQWAYAAAIPLHPSSASQGVVMQLRAWGRKQPTMSPRTIGNWQSGSCPKRKKALCCYPASRWWNAVTRGRRAFAAWRGTMNGWQRHARVCILWRSLS